MPDAPASIEIHDYEREQRLVDPQLDLGYIDGAAADVAAILHRDRRPAEVCYQPGDGTRYPLVFVPLTVLGTARPRVKRGEEWERHAVAGVARPDRTDPAPAADFYDPHAYLVVWVDHAAYPLRLGDRGVLAASYVCEHWKTGGRGADQLDSSAVSLALLFRAISHHLDRLADHAEPRAV